MAYPIIVKVSWTPIWRYWKLCSIWIPLTRTVNKKIDTKYLCSLIMLRKIVKWSSYLLTQIVYIQIKTLNKLTFPPKANKLNKIKAIYSTQYPPQAGCQEGSNWRPSLRHNSLCWATDKGLVNTSASCKDVWMWKIRRNPELK